MSRFQRFLEGCTFINSKDKLASTCAEHDEIYICTNIELFTREDILYLEGLGFDLNSEDGFRYFT